MPNKLTIADLTSPAMLAKYAAHQAACARVGIAPEKFEAFAFDVGQVPEANRASVLTIEQAAPYQPRQSYDQYKSPILKPKEQPHGESSQRDS